MNTKLTPVEKRLVIARTWSKRIDKLLAKREKQKIQFSEAEFCRKYNFDYSFFNRNKNIRVVPSQKTVDAIENALKSEGV